MHQSISHLMTHAKLSISKAAKLTTSAALLGSTILLANCAPQQKTDSAPTQAALPDTIKLYALDCGRIDMLDLDMFASNGAFKGRTNKAIDSCFLIRHPQGDLLWDTGLPKKLHLLPKGMTNGPFHVSLPITLDKQLKMLDMKKTDVEFLALSHSHFDHSGNAGQFKASTFIAQEIEYAYMFSAPAEAQKDIYDGYKDLKDAKTIKYGPSHDVFSDGKVMIYNAPGHTPGHSVLKIDLKNSGAILLTGDLYHLNESRELRTVPKFNFNEAKTLSSMDGFEKLAEQSNARVIIQHSQSDFDSLPKFPAYLD